MQTGKQIIHPGQIEIVNKAFSPSEEKVKWARDLVNAFEEQERVGKVSLIRDVKQSRQES